MYKVGFIQPYKVGYTTTTWPMRFWINLLPKSPYRIRRTKIVCYSFLRENEATTKTSFARFSYVTSMGDALMNFIINPTEPWSGGSLVNYFITTARTEPLHKKRVRESTRSVGDTLCSVGTVQSAGEHLAPAHALGDSWTLVNTAVLCGFCALFSLL